MAIGSAETEVLPVVFDYRVPSSPLSEFVEVIWYWRGHDVPRSRERVLPMGTAELIVNLATGRRGAGLAGPQSEAAIIERSSQDELLGVHFKPGGAFPFLHFPFDELRGLQVSLDDVWGAARAAELMDRLHAASTIELKFGILERWLTELARRPLKHHPAVSFALKSFDNDPGLLSSAAMADRAGLSQRRFIQLFRNEVGMTPKLFCRVLRFQQIIRTVQQQRDPDWLDVALSYGYFDQSHFIHDFREFSGLTPNEYLTLRTEHTNHVKVPD